MGRAYIFEPDRATVIEDLVIFTPRTGQVQIFQELHRIDSRRAGARMTAWDSATKNASEMIDRLTLEMNRARPRDGRYQGADGDRAARGASEDSPRSRCARWASRRE